MQPKDHDIKQLPNLCHVDDIDALPESCFQQANACLTYWHKCHLMVGKLLQNDEFVHFRQ